MSMAALPMNLNAKSKKFEKKDENKTRRHFFKNLGAIFCAILVIMAFILSRMDHIQKSHPLVSNANKQKIFFVFFELLVVII